MKIEFNDRYSATGTPYPNPHTMCLGPCEGMGVVPVRENHRDPELRARWLAAEDRAPWRNRPDPADRDGYHFVICPDCNGTRLRVVAKDGE